MLTHGVQRLAWEQIGPKITQSESLPEAVTGDRLNAAQLTIGIGIVYRAVYEVVQAGQHAQRAGQPLIGAIQTIRRMSNVAMPPDAVLSSRGWAASRNKNAP